MATSVSSDVKDSSVHEKQVQDIEKGSESVEQKEKAASRPGVENCKDPQIHLHEQRAEMLLGSLMITSREPAIMLLMFKQPRSSVFQKFVLFLFKTFSA